MRREMKNSICLITGASAGVGKVTALELAKKGFTIVIAARNADQGGSAPERDGCVEAPRNQPRCVQRRGASRFLIDPAADGNNPRSPLDNPSGQIPAAIVAGRPSARASPSILTLHAPGPLAASPRSCRIVRGRGAARPSHHQVNTTFLLPRRHRWRCSSRRRDHGGLKQPYGARRGSTGLQRSRKRCHPALVRTDS
jgi:hypothetical protein